MTQSQTAGPGMLTQDHTPSRRLKEAAAETSAEGSRKVVPTLDNTADQPRDPPSAAFLAWFGVAFVVAFGVVWIYVAMAPMAFLSRDYPLWVAKRMLMDECRLGSVLVFGDSRAMAATVPDVMPMSVTNLAQSGASPIETYFAVRRALRCPTSPKLVVIAHSASKFGGDSDYWTSFARNGFLDYGDMREVDHDAARLHDKEIFDLPSMDHLQPALRDFLFSVRFPPLYFGSLVNGFIAARWKHNHDALHDGLLSSGHAVFGNRSGSSSIAGEGHNPIYKTSPLMNLYFSRTLALLSDRGIPVLLFSMPVNRATYMRMPPEFTIRFEDYLQAEARHFPGIHVVDPVIPCWPDRFFGDAWHFNAQGATAYSRELGVRLRDVLADGIVRNSPNACTDSMPAMGPSESTVTLR
ncbi:hypothetical protein [Acidisphaera sp. S103]|uniref:hypothetical protein n=1 Tax=Acidisphaera sp. S103 TaxID=1747223 RepID=UPI00131B3FA0|nr:hypothetical protein [Acidisphaera sp. S103]